MSTIKISNFFLATFLIYLSSINEVEGSCIQYSVFAGGGALRTESHLSRYRSEIPFVAPGPTIDILPFQDLFCDY